MEESSFDNTANAGISLNSRFMSSPALRYITVCSATRRRISMSKAPASSTSANETGNNRAQLSPGDWVEAALEVLVDKSIDSVRVDVLAKGLNVTRGSFYWHFKDRDALLRQLLTTWRNTMTEQLIDRFEHSD